MTTVVLNDLERRVAKHIAETRQKENRQANVYDARITDKMDSLQIDIGGVEAEMAMCKLLNIYPTDLFITGIRSAKNGTDEGDIIFNNKKVDVKSTIHKNGCLLAVNKNVNIDVYILMTGKDGVYTCSGGLEAKQLCSKENYGNNNGKFKKACYFVTQDKLVPYKKLLDIA